MVLGFREALERVLAQAEPLAPRELPLAEALGLVAAEDVLAAEPLPLFANSAMDGFALRVADLGLGRLPVVGEVAAGRADVPSLEPGTALRIMTGAPVPEGADGILPLEQAPFRDGWVTLPGILRAGAHIRLAGEDIPAGGRVVAAGRILRPVDMGILAAIGCPRVGVHPRPRVAVITTGSELVDAGSRPGPGRIRDANIHALCAQIQAAGGIPVPFPRVEDRREAVAAALVQARKEADVVLTNGGISVGDYDFIKAVLEEGGAERIFWRVAQKPGGPLGLWGQGGRMIFGIPGNPVAAMLMFELYVRPALRRMMGHAALHRPRGRGFLEALWVRTGDPRRTEFLRVVAEGGREDARVSLAGPQGSGVLSSLTRANALAIIPEGPLDIPAGGEVELCFLDEAETP